MPVENIYDSQIEKNVLGFMPEQYDEFDFAKNHEQLLSGIRSRLIGVLSLGESIKVQQLIGRFGDDYDRLTPEQTELLTRPDTSEIEALRDEFKSERTILTAVKAIYNQRLLRSATEN